MTRLGLRPYRPGDEPATGTVPLSVVVLTCNEEPNIARCLSSVRWASQVVVIDSGSTDGTLSIARALGAEVVEQPWLGFSAQREFALRLSRLRHDWVYFVDADEWVSPQLASELAALAAQRRLRGIRPSSPAGLPGQMDPALRLVSRLLGGPARGPAVHEIRRQPGRRAGLRRWAGGPAEQ